MLCRLISVNCTYACNCFYAAFGVLKDCVAELMMMMMMIAAGADEVLLLCY